MKGSVEVGMAHNVVIKELYVHEGENMLVKVNNSAESVGCANRIV